MIYLNYHGVVAATAVGPMGPGRKAEVVAPEPDPAQGLWSDDVDDAAYFLRRARPRLALVEVWDTGPEP